MKKQKNHTTEGGRDTINLSEIKSPESDMNTTDNQINNSTDNEVNKMTDCLTNNNSTTNGKETTSGAPPTIQETLEQCTQFFEAIGKPLDNVYIRAIDPKRILPTLNKDKQRISEPTIKYLRKLNDKGYEIYSVVNGGGHTAASINETYASFFEIDEHDYTSEKMSFSVQSEVWREVDLPQPTIVVCTGGKSLHQYLAYEESQNVTKEKWKQLQEQLMATIPHTDTAIKDFSRIMRLPGFEYHKDGLGNYSYIYDHCGDTYTVAEIEENLLSYEESHKRVTTRDAANKAAKEAREAAHLQAETARNAAINAAKEAGQTDEETLVGIGEKAAQTVLNAAAIKAGQDVMDGKYEERAHYIPEDDEHNYDENGVYQGPTAEEQEQNKCLHEASGLHPDGFQNLIKLYPKKYQQLIAEGSPDNQDSVGNKIMNHAAALYQRGFISEEQAKEVLTTYFGNCKQDPKDPFTDKDVKRHWKSANKNTRDIIGGKWLNKQLIKQDLAKTRTVQSVTKMLYKQYQKIYIIGVESTATKYTRTIKGLKRNLLALLNNYTINEHEAVSVLKQFYENCEGARVPDDEEIMVELNAQRESIDELRNHPNGGPDDDFSYTEHMDKCYGKRIRLNKMGDYIEKDGQRMKNIKQFYLLHKDEFEFKLKKDLAVDLVILHAEKNAYHPIQDYLDSLRSNHEKFDKKTAGANLRAFLVKCGITDKWEQTAAIRCFIGAVARIYNPGCKVDLMLILKGPQGYFKSTLLDILGGPGYVDLSGDPTSKDGMMECQSGWLIEMAEVEKFTRTKEAFTTKSIITRRDDKYRKPYAIETLSNPRQFLFFGTTNEDELFLDATGNRRYIVANVNHRIDREFVTANRDNFWTWISYLYHSGEQWWLTDAEVEQQTDRNKDAAVTDARTDAVLNYARGKEYVKVDDILTELWKVEPGHSYYKKAQHELAKILKLNGFNKKRRVFKGIRTTVWETPDDVRNHSVGDTSDDVRNHEKGQAELIQVADKFDDYVPGTGMALLRQEHGR